MDKHKIDFIREWIYEGNNDLGLAKFVIDNDGPYYDLVCFHCQQAAEKYLKAYIIYLGLYYKKIHNLQYLLSVIERKHVIPKKLYKTAEMLEKFATDSRYPDYWHDPTLKETEECIKAAEMFKEFIKPVLDTVVEKGEKLVIGDDKSD
ncbi:MAG: HEPN domain-containing protein [Halanaerobiales bacterium]|nr:HEPN domain-containing protein [Halanaerobiales bacterium]